MSDYNPDAADLSHSRQKSLNRLGGVDCQTGGCDAIATSNLLPVARHYLFVEPALCPRHFCPLDKPRESHGTLEYIHV